MNIILVIFIIYSIFISSVLIYSEEKHCSPSESTQQFKSVTNKYYTSIRNTKLVNYLVEVIKDHLPSNEQLIYYPVFIGFNGVTIIPEYVDFAFKSLYTLFEVSYFEYYNNAFDNNVIQYVFSIKRKSDFLEDDELYKLVQKTVESILSKHLHNEFNYSSAERLTAVNIHDNHLFVYFATTDTGINELDKIKENNRKKYISNDKSDSPMLISWNDIKEKMMWGYYRSYYNEHGLTLPINIDISSHPHALITGSSGSGKSVSLLFLIGVMLKSNPNIIPFICDFKNSEDFAFLKDYKHYYSGSDCYEGIMSYYERFSELREQGNNTQRYILIFDEYPAFINHLQQLDKTNKTKKANDVLGAISELLMLGRGLSFGVWLVTQRADSTLFANGARDNFMVFLGLGRMSREQKGMVFTGQDIPDIVFDKGEGMLLADGKDITEVKFPLISDMEDWKKNILNLLLNN